MTHEIPDQVKRWKAKRRQALILQLVCGETSAAGEVPRGQGHDALQTFRALGSPSSLRQLLEAGHLYVHYR